MSFRGFAAHHQDSPTPAPAAAPDPVPPAPALAPTSPAVTEAIPMTPAEIIAALELEVTTYKTQIATLEEAYDKFKAAYDATAAERDQLKADAAEAATVATAFGSIESTLLPAIKTATASGEAFLSKLTGHVQALPSSAGTPTPTATSTAA